MSLGLTYGRDNGVKKIANMPVPGKNVFIENVGQLKDENNRPRRDIDFKLPGNNSLNIFVAPGKLLYQWAKPGKNPQNGEAVFYQLQVALEGANTSVKPTVYNKQVYRENFYTIGNEGHIAHSYQKLIYKNIYPHIDWIVSAAEGNASGMKYEFLVHKGGDPKQIKLRYYGADNIALKNGHITATTSFGTIEEEKPYCYTTANKKTVNSSFQLNKNTITFDIDAYDGELLIDPSIFWGTYFGNPSNTQGFAIVTDSLDNSFLCGKTSSTTDIIVSTYASQVNYGGGSSDAFIVKFNVNGTILWSTYYGSNDAEQFSAIAYDRSTNGVIVGGYTTSASNVGLGIIATPGAYQSINGGTGFSGSSIVDAMIAKFDDTGKLVWGTFFGGTQEDRILTIACDKYGFIYFGGATSSTNAIASSGASRPAPAPGFVEKFSPIGTRIWGTYICGTVNAITVDADNKIYIGGITDSVTGLATSGSHQSSFVGGSTDGFIAKFNDAGSRLWSSYYGGWGYDEVFCMITDSFRNLYVGGSTLSTQNIATTGSLKPTHSAALSNPPTIYDGFLAKFDSAGIRKWATYFGDSSGMDLIKSATIGPDGKIYIAGTTGSLSSIATPGAFHSTWGGPPPIYISGPYPPNGPMDIFLEKFTQKGERIWGTYIGGGGEDSYPNVAYGAGKLYVGGSTASASGIATAYVQYVTNGGYQQSITNSGNTEAFIEQFYADTSVYFKFPYIDTLLCAGDSLKVNYKVTNLFKLNNVFSVQLSDSSGNFTATSPIIGTKTDYREGVIACRIPPTTLENTHYSLRILASNPKDTFYNYDVKIAIYKYHVPDVYANPNPICENAKLNLDDFNFPYAPSYTWIGPAGFSVPSTHNAFRDTIKMSHAGNYILIADNHGCIGRDTVTVTVLPSPADAYIVGDTSLCLGDTLNLTATCTTPGVTYAWIGPYNPPNTIKSSATQTFVIPDVSYADSGYYKVASVLNGVCYSNQEATKRRVTIHPIPKPTASSNTPICEKETIVLTASDTITTGITYTWSGPGGFTHNSKDTSILNSNPTYSGRYIVRSTSIHGCSDTNSTNVIVKPLPNQPDATNNSPICSGGTLMLNNVLTTPSATYAWTGPNGFSSSQLNPNITSSQVSNSGIYTITVDLAGCKRSDTTLVTINKTPDKPILSSNSPLHVGDAFIKLNINNPDVAANYTWSGPNSFSTTAVNPVLNNVVKNMGGKYIVVASIAGCTSSDSIIVQVDDNPVTEGKSFIITPNPNKGIFTILASVETDSDMPLNIYASDGKLVYSDVLKPVNKKVVQTVDVSGKLATGIYRIKIRVDGKTSTYNLLIGQ